MLVKTESKGSHMTRGRSGLLWGIPFGALLVGVALFRDQGPRLEEGPPAPHRGTDRPLPPFPTPSQRAPSHRTADAGADIPDSPPPITSAPGPKDSSPPRELVKKRIRETYRRYCAAVAEGDEEALELLRPTLRFERELVLDCAQEELLLATDPVKAGIIERTMADLRD